MILADSSATHREVVELGADLEIRDNPGYTAFMTCANTCSDGPIQNMPEEAQIPLGGGGVLTSSI